MKHYPSIIFSYVYTLYATTLWTLVLILADNQAYTKKVFNKKMMGDYCIYLENPLIPIIRRTQGQKNKYLSNFLIKLLFFNKMALYLHIEKQ